MSIYADLLFMHGHIANVELAKQLAGSDATASVTEPEAGTSKARQERRNHEQAGAPEGATTQTPDSRLNR